MKKLYLALHPVFLLSFALLFGSSFVWGQAVVQTPPDGLARAWIYATNSAGTYTTQASYNASQSKTGTGALNITFSPAFSSANYVVVCTGAAASNPSVGVSITSASVAAIDLRVANTVTATDMNFFCVAYGR